MPQIYLPKPLYDSIVQKGEDVNEFVQAAVKEKLNKKATADK